jgi:hypothetical protein
MDPIYHPHFPSTDNDHYERLTNNAQRMANPFRLAMYKYSPDEEARCLQAWEAVRRAKK